ncbi:MAG: nicotinate (nicotinamide) nucleotide adenylyltransferase [Phycisphaerales bacterium]|nr:nicotinate (nicotinamide) nucleotide adenylyltransferase [Phycisphaerales bacterium]
MATLYFGGSFNPIHHGHLICAREVAESAGYDKIVLIPCGQPPHKLGSADLAAPQHRLEMCRLAVALDPLFAVDTIEMDQPGPSYTLNTVQRLKARGVNQIDWLIGADMLAFLPQWHQPQVLIQQAKIIIMARPGWSFQWHQLPAFLQPLQHNVVHAPMIDLSASTIRQRCRSGANIAYLTPPSVADYIHTHKLYRQNQP